MICQIFYLTVVGVVPFSENLEFLRMDLASSRPFALGPSASM